MLLNEAGLWLGKRSLIQEIYKRLLRLSMFSIISSALLVQVDVRGLDLEECGVLLLGLWSLFRVGILAIVFFLVRLIMEGD